MRGHLAGYALHHFDSGIFQRRNLFGIVGEQAHLLQSQRLEDGGGQAGVRAGFVVASASALGQRLVERQNAKPAPASREISIGDLADGKRKRHTLIIYFGYSGQLPERDSAASCHTMLSGLSELMDQ